jgi:hypothetical protein
MLSIIFFQTALDQHLMPKGLCNAPIVAKLRKGIGFMQMVPDLHMTLTWRSGLMMKTFMILTTQTWYMTMFSLLLNYSCLSESWFFLVMLAICFFPLNFPVVQCFPYPLDYACCLIWFLVLLCSSMYMQLLAMTMLSYLNFFLGALHFFATWIILRPF